MEVVAQSTSSDLTAAQYTIHCNTPISTGSIRSESREELVIGCKDSPETGARHNILEVLIRSYSWCIVDWRRRRSL
jgi:hypothetical protein